MRFWDDWQVHRYRGTFHQGCNQSPKKYKVSSETGTSKVQTSSSHFLALTLKRSLGHEYTMNLVNFVQFHFLLKLFTVNGACVKSITDYLRTASDSGQTRAAANAPSSSKPSPTSRVHHEKHRQAQLIEQQVGGFSNHPITTRTPPEAMGISLLVQLLEASAQKIATLRSTRHTSFPTVEELKFKYEVKTS